MLKYKGSFNVRGIAFSESALESQRISGRNATSELFLNVIKNYHYFCIPFSDHLAFSESALESQRISGR